jgi:hypothetical protein
VSNRKVEELHNEELHEFTPLNKYHQDDGMAGTCISHGRKREDTQRLIQKIRRKVITWKPWVKGRKIILNWTLKKLRGIMWTGLIWPSIGTSGDLS